MTKSAYLSLEARGAWAAIRAWAAEGESELRVWRRWSWRASELRRGWGGETSQRGHSLHSTQQTGISNQLY